MSADAYFLEHRASLERAVAGAIESTLNARPADPLAYIGQLLLSQSTNALPSAKPLPSAVAPAASPERNQQEVRQASDGTGEAASEGQKWTAAEWLSSLGVVSCLATALLGTPAPDDELGAIRGLAGASEEELAKRIQEGRVAETMAAMLRPQLCKLADAEAATGVELHGKFVQEGAAFTMKYGDLSTFFGGLEAKIGPPRPNVREAMTDEHVRSSDSQDEFTTGNYGVTTTPEIEWSFVVTVCL